MRLSVKSLAYVKTTKVIASRRVFELTIYSSFFEIMTVFNPKHAGLPRVYYKCFLVQLCQPYTVVCSARHFYFSITETGAKVKVW